MTRTTQTCVLAKRSILQYPWIFTVATLGLTACASPQTPTDVPNVSDTFVDDLLAIDGADAQDVNANEDVQVLDTPSTDVSTADAGDARMALRCMPAWAADNLPTTPSVDPTGCYLRDAMVDVHPTWMAPDGGVTDGGLPPAIHGPGGPTRTFAPSELNQVCAYLDGGPTDRDHHNAVTMLDGYLIMPWAHEGMPGGVSVWEFTDPCNPVHVSTTLHPDMRETHLTGFSFMNGRWLNTASRYGVQFWDISDFRNVRMVKDFALPNVCYPDSYRRVVLGTFWQAPYLYVGAADNGVYVVDASDPSNPRYVNRYVTGNSVGMVYAIGNLLYVLNSEGSSQNILDISDPNTPRPIPGGNFNIGDGRMSPSGVLSVLPAYSGTVVGNRAYFTRHVLGGGLFIYDVADPRAPRFLGHYHHQGPANGGYVLLQNEFAFVGLSQLGVVLDVTNPAQPRNVAEFRFTGDLDFVNPIGNVVVLSVDDDAVDGQASGILPFREQPDQRAPTVNMVVPRDGAMDQALTTRVGITFDEFVDVQTASATTFIVREVNSATPLQGYYSGQESALNFWPAQPLRPNTEYEVIVPTNGITDYNRNPTAVTFRSTFRTTACP